MAIHKGPSPGSTTILDASSIYPRKWGEAVKHVAAGLSKEKSPANPAYAVVVSHKSYAKCKPNYLVATKAFAKAYTRGMKAISGVEHEILTTSDKGRLTTLQPENYIRVFVGKASAKDIKQQIQASPGIYIIPSHLDTGFLAHLSLDPVPELLRDVPMVIQIEDPDLWAEEESAIGLDDSREASGKSVIAADPEAAVEKNTLEWRKRFIAENPHWTSAQIAQESTSLAKNQPATASRWAKEKKVFAVDFQGQKRFPQFQFQNGRPIPAVSQVIKVFPEHATGWELGFFFATPNANISGRKPFELLKEDASQVVSLAQVFVHPADVF